jgi:hypothetical protein
MLVMATVVIATFAVIIIGCCCRGHGIECGHGCGYGIGHNQGVLHGCGVGHGPYTASFITALMNKKKEKKKRKEKKRKKLTRKPSATATAIIGHVCRHGSSLHCGCSGGSVLWPQFWGCCCGHDHSHPHCGHCTGCVPLAIVTTKDKSNLQGNGATLLGRCNSSLWCWSWLKHWSSLLSSTCVILAMMNNLKNEKLTWQLS